MKQYKCQILINAILWITIIFYPNYISAQDHKAQKLEAKLRLETRQDTNRFKALDNLIWYYKDNQYDSALKYSKEALILAKKINYPQGIAIAYIRMGLIYQNKGQYKTSLKYCQKALSLEKKISHEYGIARANNQIGSIYLLMRQYNLAIKYFKQSTFILQKIKKYSLIPSKKVNLALCYENLGDTKKAIKLYFEAIEFLKKTKQRNQLGSCYLSLSILYRKVNNLLLAQKFLLKALEVFKSKNNKKSIAKVNHELGVLFFKIKDYAKSISYYSESLKQKRALGTNQNIQVTYNNLGYVYLKNNELEQAQHFLQTSYKMAKQIKDTLTLALASNNLGLLHHKYTDYKKAVISFKESLLFSKKLSEKHNYRNTLENLSITYGKLGNYQKAFQYFQKYNQVNNTLETSFRQAMNIKDQYEAEKKKRELAEKDKKIKDTELARLQEYSSRQSLGNWFLGIGFLLSLMIVFAIVRNQQERRKVRKKQDHIDHLLKEQESIALNNMLEGQEKERSRIGQDLHDRLGGMLSVVKYRFEAFNQSTKIQQVTKGIEQYEQAMTLLDDACEEVRKVSHNISSKTLQRFGLLAALKDLTAHLGNNALKTNLISQGFEGKQLPDKYKVQIYRMIQELVGNVLKHAEATELAIQLFWRPDHINIGIEDNGKGFDPDNTKAYGLGLEGVKFRAKNLQGEFTLDSQQGEGTSVLINIPLNEIDQENTTATSA